MPHSPEHHRKDGRTETLPYSFSKSVSPLHLGVSIIKGNNRKKKGASVPSVPPTSPSPSRRLNDTMTRTRDKSSKRYPVCGRLQNPCRQTSHTTTAKRAGKQANKLANRPNRRCVPPRLPCHVVLFLANTLIYPRRTHPCNRPMVWRIHSPAQPASQPSIHTYMSAYCYPNKAYLITRRFRIVTYRIPSAGRYQ